MAKGKKYISGVTATGNPAKGSTVKYKGGFGRVVGKRDFPGYMGFREYKIARAGKTKWVRQELIGYEARKYKANVKKGKGKGRGWHGDPAGHAAARRKAGKRK